MLRAIVEELGGPEALRFVEEPEPTPGPGEVAVRVRAIGCNFFDTLMLAGRYQIRPPLPFTPGGEFAGEVSAVGRGVTRFAPGDRVVAVLSYGAYASCAVVPEGAVRAIPDAMPFSQAAALPIVYGSALLALTDRAALRPGEILVVHAAAGGVGLAAVQLGRALGAVVLGTAGSDEKCALARAQGADEVWNYRAVDWVEALRVRTGGLGADVFIDPVGGDVFDGSLSAIAFGGRLVVVGFASGRIPTVAANRIMLKNIAVTGLHWGAYLERAPARVDTAMGQLFALWEAGTISPLISEERPLTDAAAALRAIDARDTVGKVVLVP